jgi:cation transport ATPase
MKIKLLLVIVCFIFSFSNTTFASEANNNKIDVSVKGMVCDFCARGIEKVFKKEKAVKAINVDLSNQKITVELNIGETMSDSYVTKLIESNGVSVVKVSRKIQKIKDDA